MTRAGEVRTGSSKGTESRSGHEARGGQTLHFRKTWRAIGWALVVTVVVLSLLPIPGPVPGGDKLQHALVYFAMTAWFCNLAVPGLYVGIGLRLLLLGAVLEVLQGFTGYRSSEWLDLLADATGISLAILACRGRLGGVLVDLDRRLAATVGP